MAAVMAIANSIARGTSRVGLMVSSARPPAVSKPYSTQAPVSMLARKALPYPKSAPGPDARRRVEQHAQTLVIALADDDHHVQRDGDHHEPDDLGDRPDVVEERRHLDAQDVEDHRPHGVADRDPEQRRRVAPIPAQQGADDGRHAEADGRDRHHEGGREHPGDPPAVVAAHEPLAPLVDAAGQRVVRGRLGEDQRDHELAEDDDRPLPDQAGRAADVEAEVEERVEAVGRRDEAEGDGERGEEAEGAPQVLVVAELGQLLLVALVLRVHLVVEHVVLVMLVRWLFRHCAPP